MNKKIVQLSLIGLLGIIGTPVIADSPSITWRGFFDLQYSGTKRPAETAYFRWGQFELDLESNLSDTIALEGAVAYDSGAQSFGLGCGLLKINAAKNLEIAFGQFDIPLGIDYKYYPSPNRPMISSPLLNEAMYNNWNDLGIRLSLNFGANLNTILYMVNGQNSQAGQNESCAAGGRASAVIGNTEFGCSLAHDPAQKDNFYGLDLSLTGNNITLISEYMHVKNDGINNAAAYYILAKYDFEPYFLIGRYDYYNQESGYSRDESALSDTSRISVGGGLKIEPQTELRMEYQCDPANRNLDSNQNVILLQAVVQF